MRQQIEARVLRVYIGDADQSGGEPLFAKIVETLRHLGIAGVTVLRGTEGYGVHAKLHTSRLENLFNNLPIIIEAVDIPDRIAIAAAALDEMLVEGLVTIHDVTAIRYIKDPKE